MCFTDLVKKTSCFHRLNDVNSKPFHFQTFPLCPSMQQVPLGQSLSVRGFGRGRVCRWSSLVDEAGPGSAWTEPSHCKTPGASGHKGVNKPKNIIIFSIKKNTVVPLI